jgi:hypothetical protein
MPAIDRSRSRRRYLAGLSAVLSSVLAGCTGATRVGEGAPPTEEPPACAEGVRISEASARIGDGRVPAVTLRVHNAGDAVVEYEVVVIFQQGTSLGIDARTGRDTLSGRVGPGETVTATATATDDAQESRNTDDYELDVSLACSSA